MMYFLPGVMRNQFSEMSSTNDGKLLVGLIAGSPLLVGMFGCMLGGFLTDRYVRRTGDRKWGRRKYAMIGYGMAGVCYLLATLFIGNFWAFAICIMMMGFFNDLIMGSAWATCQDVGRRYAAIVSGCMNMVGNLAGALTNFITGTVLKAYEGDQATGITIMFTTYAAVYFIGVLLWLGIDATKPIVPDEPQRPTHPESGTPFLDE
jgi:MFS transporter, ACS family, glucarate transporter